MSRSRSRSADSRRSRSRSRDDDMVDDRDASPRDRSPRDKSPRSPRDDRSKSGSPRAAVRDASPRNGRSPSSKRDRSMSVESTHSECSADDDYVPFDPKDCDDCGTDTMEVEDADAAFILGKGGKTKQKIARVAKCIIELDEKTVEMTGSEKARRRARRYLECVMKQRKGTVSLEDDDEDERTLLDIPENAVGFVTGRGGNFLRTIELEWEVLMLFAKVSGHEQAAGCETLVIFGDERNRRGAELKIMSAAEHKVEGLFSDKFKDEPEKCKKDGFYTDYMTLKEKEISYALGPKGRTRKKIAAASGCIVEYIGNIAFFSGTYEQRTRARSYMEWLFAQLEGPVNVDWRSRKDCTCVEVPDECVGYITGAKRAALGNVESEFGVLMFFMGTRMEKGKERSEEKPDGFERLLIFGPTRSRKGAQLKIESCVEKKEPGHFTKGVKDHTSSYKGFSVDTMYLKDEHIQYALGRSGATRMKLAAASGCILQYVGNLVFMAGTKKERERCRDYLNWLLDQKDGAVLIKKSEAEDRDDMISVDVPKDVIGVMTGNKGAKLRKIEESTNTFCFMALDGETDKSERMLIMGGPTRRPPEGQIYDGFPFDGLKQAKTDMGWLVKDAKAGKFDRRDRDRDYDRRGGGRDSYRGGRDRRRSRSYDRGGRGGGYGRRDDRDRSRRDDRDRSRRDDRDRDYDRRDRRDDRDRSRRDYDRSRSPRRRDDRDRRDRDRDRDRRR